MSQIFVSCGAPFREDVEASTPGETQDQRLAREARSRKNARKTARKQPAKIALDVLRRTLPAQAALVRVSIHAGNDTAAHMMAKALLESFLWTGYASLTGAKYSEFPMDRMAAKLRAADLIDSAAFAAIIVALSTSPELPTSAGVMLKAVEAIAFGAESESEVARRSRRKRILREGERLAESCDITPGVEDAGRAPSTIADAGIVHETEFRKVLGIDWETWQCDYRMRIPGLTTPQGRYYLLSDLTEFVAKHSKPSDVQPVQVAGGAE